MIKNPFSLENKTIVITGASSGIGQQCAISCSEMGAKVVLIGRNVARLNETLKKMSGSLHYVLPLDLTDFDSIKSSVKDVVSKCGRIDGVIHCAGISTTLPLNVLNEDKMTNFFHTNVYSALLLTKEVCRNSNFSKEGGSVIFIASIMGCVGESGKALYSMTKGALLAGARSLACEYAHRKIRFNTISPGAILTPINASLPHMTDPELKEALTNKHLLGLGQTTDIANACIYLLSDASRWITGTNLVVDGGYTAQ